MALIPFSSRVVFPLLLLTGFAVPAGGGGMDHQADSISYRKANKQMEIVRYRNWTKSYAPHTHTAHLTLGYVEDGKIRLTANGESRICEKGDTFRIPPDTLHEISAVDGESYSMMVLCVRTEPEPRDTDLQKLRAAILEQPENLYLIHEMAKDTHISPYYMIRRFRKAFGLTPHQFQIQCRVRKAQKLLEKEKSISRVTYDAGFSDQSHLDRCFQKLVGLTPAQYRDTIREEDQQSAGKNLANK